MTKLQKNTKSHILITLYNLSSFENQERYKRSVPFVHVPYELIAQVDSYLHIKDKKWFIDIWNKDELDAILQFLSSYQNIITQIEENLDDVPKIFKNIKWTNLKLISKDCYFKINNET